MAQEHKGGLWHVKAVLLLGIGNWQQLKHTQLQILQGVGPLVNVRTPLEGAGQRGQDHREFRQQIQLRDFVARFVYATGVLRYYKRRRSCALRSCGGGSVVHSQAWLPLTTSAASAILRPACQEQQVDASLLASVQT